MKGFNNYYMTCEHKESYISIQNYSPRQQNRRLQNMMQQPFGYQTSGCSVWQLQSKSKPITANMNYSLNYVGLHAEFLQSVTWKTTLP